jgi:hypothetical protein
MQAFFSSENGILFNGNHSLPWIQLGVNLFSMICIILWAGTHSFVIFGGLNYFGLLRVDLDTELKGLDITKHGEDAYQVHDWNKESLDTSTQTSLTLNCENYFEKNKKSFLKYQRKQPNREYDNSYENEFLAMDNLKTILRNCKV